MGLFSASSTEQAPLNYHSDNCCKYTIIEWNSQEKRPNNRFTCQTMLLFHCLSSGVYGFLDIEWAIETAI